MRIFVIALVLSLAAPCFAQHLGARVQWQPETADTDTRLQQPVEIEILGRAAVPAMQMLSEKTGVSLSVAPEDLSTVGERKLTIISKNLTLKALMVQIPAALQECHWDMDASGEAPVYLLHRNAGADQTMQWLTDREAARQAEQQRSQRMNRMEEAKRALQMSPDELAELEKTDLLLARSVRDPHSRDMLEILLTLPPEQAEQFRDTGRLELDYAQAPERWQKAVQRIAEWWVVRMAGEELPDEVRNWRGNLSHARISFEDNRVEHGWGVWLSLSIPSGQEWPRIHDVALHPKYCNLDEGQLPYTRLLVATGVPDEDTAFQMAIERDKEGFRTDAAKREERHQREWIEPTDAALLQTIVIGDRKFADFTELEAFIANETGIPIVSDSFTLPAPYLWDEVRQGIPLWRLLYLIGEDDFRSEDIYLWQKRGNCLVFHRADWAALAKMEIPESIILAYREKIAAQGELTLNDLAELATILSTRKLPASAFPEDLQRAGVRLASHYSQWALLLYASLTPEQLQKLRSPEGLPFAEMTIAQRQIVLQRAANRSLPVPQIEAYRASFHLAESSEERRGRRFDKTELQLRFPGVTDSALVGLKVINPPPQPTP
jgi:hypothetical protein